MSTLPCQCEGECSGDPRAPGCRYLPAKPVESASPTAFAIEAIRADERARIGQAIEALPTSGPVSFLGIAEVRTLSADRFKADVLALLRESGGGHAA